MKTMSAHFFSFYTATLLTACMCGIPATAHSQSSDRNYILTRTFTKEDGTTSQDKVDYYDGLRRLEQSVLKNAALNGGDIVTLQEYDNLEWESTIERKWKRGNNYGS